MVDQGLKDRMRRAAQRLGDWWERRPNGDWYERRCNENIAISTAMASTRPDSPINYPSWYAGFLRDCIRPQRHRLKEIKASRRSTSAAARRFDTLLDMLSSDVPPLPLSTAQVLGQIADALLASTQTYVQETFIGDVGIHFSGSSSFGRAGRIISSIVRMMKGHRCLELGTAYGMSAAFTITALQRNGDQAHLTTVEAGETQFSLASRMLESSFPGYVSCHKGLTYEVLPTLVPTLGTIDFTFHDAGHSREDYIRDYGLVEPALASGSTMLIDDINWANPRFYKGAPHTYEGWKAIASSERVERAIEIDGRRGLILLS